MKDNTTKQNIRNDSEKKNNYLKNIVIPELERLKASIRSSSTQTGKNFYTNRYDVQKHDFAEVLGVSDNEVEKMVTNDHKG